MDNPSRSERTRKAALQAALAIIARDGPGRLTLDAIARESGISKGGVMHQFRSKQAVLQALLEQQVTHFDEFTRRYLATTSSPQPRLSAEIATLREAAKPNSAALALLAAMVDDPSLLSASRDASGVGLAQIKEEAADPDLALLRWSAARGLALSELFGLCPLSERERARLFERLLDDTRWSALEKPVKAPVARSAVAKRRRRG